jgi:HK97 family phage major capsid protein/HK97 family phage prohead protease
MQRAYAILHVKAIDEDKRIISGIATTPEPDRMGDVIEPLGVSFKNPLPLLLHHDTKQPVGFTTLKKPTKDGVEFTATLPTIDEPGSLKTRVDEAWQSIKAGLIPGVSIGFRSIEEAFNKDTGGFRFLKSEVVELSLVTIPANASASIHTIKSLDTADLAASGLHAPGVSGSLPIVRAGKAAPKMADQSIADQISAFENTRAARAARMNEIQTKAAGRTKDEAEREEFDTIEREIASIDRELVDLRKMETVNLTKATAITSTTNQIAASELRSGGSPFQHVTVKANVPKGTAFARMCMAMAAGHGDSYQTLQYAKQWKDSTPEVEQMVEHMWRTKAAVAVGTTTDATWAGPLVVTQPLNEFLEMLRPRTLLGRIPGLRQVPFNVSVPRQTTGGTYGWVGQNKPKPVTKADYATVTVPFAKAAGIIVLSEELVTLSTPSAEALVREEMIAGMGAFLDVQFNDPAVAVAANVSPASITNGAATAAATGVTAAAAKLDLAGRVAVFAAANIPLDGSVWLMSDSNAFGLSMSMNALGQPLFPGMTAQGGTLFGMPVVVSNSLSTRVVLVHAPSILYADEGGVRIDVSREASVQMDSAPTDTVDATTVYLSLWQRNLIGLKAERMITWIRARSAAVTYLTAAAYVGT